MLRSIANGSLRLGIIAAAALMLGGLGADIAEAKRGFSLGKSVTRASKSDSDGNDARKGSEDGDAEATHRDGEHSESTSTDKPAEDGEGSRVGIGVNVKLGTSEDKAGTPVPRAKAAAKPADGKYEPAAKDYYGRRADDILKTEDGLVNAKAHPLAAAHPGMDVVVCEGGCNEVPAEIVFMRPTTYKPKSAEQIAAEKAAKAANVKGPKIVAPSAPGTPASKDIVCLGGCYDTPGMYTAAASRDVQPVALGEWMTSVTPTSATPAKPGSGDWMRKIDANRPDAPADAPKN